MVLYADVLFLIDFSAEQGDEQGAYGEDAEKRQQKQKVKAAFGGCRA